MDSHSLIMIAYQQRDEWKEKAERFALELEVSQKRVATLETAIQNLSKPLRRKAPLLLLPAPWQEGGSFQQEATNSQ